MNSNAKGHREAVRLASRPSIYSIHQEGDDVEQHLYKYIDLVWNQELPKFHINLLKEKHVSEIKDYQDSRVSIFVAACGLITFGRKDVIPFILQDIPILARLHLLATVIFDLLPLPDKLKNLQKKTEILEWLETHYDQLTWDEEKEVFYLNQEASS